MTVKAQLRLQGPMDHLRVVWQAGEALLESVPFRNDPDGTRYNVLLAVQEMVTNVIRHGYHGDEDQPILVEFAADGEGMWIEIRDRGPAFNPAHVSVCPPGGDSVPRAEGGYGIMITRTVMDEFDYAREGDWNVLRMFKSAVAVSETAQKV